MSKLQETCFFVRVVLPYFIAVFIGAHLMLQVGRCAVQ